MSDDEERLNFAALRDEIESSGPGPTPGLIESRLCAAVSKRRFRRRMRLGAIGLGVCLLLLILGWRLTVRPQALEPSISYAGFVALPYAQSDVPMEQAVVVRVSLRPDDLALLGLPAALLRSRSSMRADLLIGQDGIARAVRLSEER